MNTAKLRRSRDVSEPYRVKIKNTFIISDLAMLNMAFYVGSNGEESAYQVAVLLAKSQLTGRQRRRQSLYIFSGEHPTAHPSSWVFPL